ncbi:hypothetical protein DQ384_38570 [Sphaerisporangium album]|uniref:Uncharacterized protein n=1 Tax=Sphaerisporangium album TaxID=509200 RepID=A0A367EMQ2_9ACTN|nr:hypothetical protein [Sphaerisporangium album]RCG19039.1 hypothetical protein DQ384_38570 [Sphaerisporangium album]
MNDAPQADARPLPVQAQDLIRDAARADLVVMPHRQHLGPAYAALHTQRPAFDRATAALDWLEQHLPTIQHMINLTHQQGMHHLPWQLCETLGALLLYRPAYGVWVSTHELALESAHLSTSARALAQMMRALAAAYQGVARFTDAAALYEQAACLEHDAGYLRGEALALEGLGAALVELGRVNEALEVFKRAHAMFAYLGHPQGEALITRRIGAALGDAGRYQQATTMLLEAFQSFAQDNDLFNQAGVLLEWAKVSAVQGKSQRAKIQLETAAKYAYLVGARAMEATASAWLGKIAIALDEGAEAQRHLSHACQLLTKMGSPQADEVQMLLEELSPA